MGLTQLVDNIKLSTKKGHEAMVKERAESVKKMADRMAKMSSEGEGTPEFNAASKVYED
jgi:C4-dicarboxylate-specific signal transduction histidine kinase